jgi:hypothetical protein
MADYMRRPTGNDDAAISRYMRALETATLQTMPVLPDARVMWLRASLVRRWAAERRVEQPLEKMQWVHIAVGAVAAVVLFTWSAPALLQSLRLLSLPN